MSSAEEAKIIDTSGSSLSNADLKKNEDGSALGNSTKAGSQSALQLSKSGKETSNLAKAGSRFGSLKNLLGVSGGNKELTDSSTQPAASSDDTATKYENTYRMKPDKKFQSEKVQRIIEQVLQQHLNKFKYDADTVVELTKTISNELLEAIKKLEYDRYKFVVDVTLGEFKGQGIRVASRCLWDMSVDSYASASFKNSTTFAVAMVFGIYFE